MKILCKDYFGRIILFVGIGFIFSCGLPKNNIHFWDIQRRGANTFTPNFTRDIVTDAIHNKIGFLRIAPDKWPTKARDFLIGNADKYEGLVGEDLAKLKEVLNYFEQVKYPVTLTMLSLPGSRWKQNNNDQDDLRLWESEDYQMQAQVFWKDLAFELKDYTCVVGYNILNEPHLDRLWQSSITENTSIEVLEEIQQKLANFYEDVIMSIRESDAETFIVLDASWYGDTRTMPLMQPHSEPRILYSFHMYEPYSFTNFALNEGKYRYPEDVEKNEGMSPEIYFAQFIDSVREFQQAHNIPNNRILVGEFGVDRRVPGAQQYLQDLIALFNAQNWHWAVYAFRDLDWEGMDYELGTGKLPWEIWKEGEDPDYLAYHIPNSLFATLQEAWASTPRP